MPASVKALENMPEGDQEKSNNFLRVMANRPEILNSYKPLHHIILAPGALERRLKVLAYLAASYANESPYDVGIFHSLALQEGFSEDDVRAVRTEQDHVFAPREHGVVRMARELTRTCSLDDIDSNEVNLFTAEQLVELVSAVALANFDNRFSNALDVQQEHIPAHTSSNPATS